MTLTMRRLFQPQTVAVTERLGDPFVIRFRIRCCRCGTPTPLVALLSLALDLASEHAAVHVADGQRKERAA